MQRTRGWNTSSKLLVTGCGAMLLGLLLGAKPHEADSDAAVKGDAQAVDLFAAIDAGQLEAKLILQDEFQGKVLLRNKTGAALSVRIPEVLAGVPVLGQNVGNNPFDPNGQTGQTGQSGSGQSQPVGGATNVNNSGPNGAGQPGFFNVPAERVAQLNFRSVCLEHGKVSPRAVMKYRLAPLSEATEHASVGEVIKAYVRGHCTQEAAQAAAWHFASDMSWDQLAAIQIRRATGARTPYFTSAGLQEAKRLAEKSQAADLPKDSLATQQ